jgi:hypothetical protein
MGWIFVEIARNNMVPGFSPVAICPEWYDIAPAIAGVKLAFTLGSVIKKKVCISASAKIAWNNTGP